MFKSEINKKKNLRKLAKGRKYWGEKPWMDPGMERTQSVIKAFPKDKMEDGAYREIRRKDLEEKLSEKVSNATLARRLELLRISGVIKRRVDPGPPIQAYYKLGWLYDVFFKPSRWRRLKELAGFLRNKAKEAQSKKE